MKLSTAVIALGVLIIVIGVIAPSLIPLSIPCTGVCTVVALAILPDGTTTTYAIYQVGQEMKVATTVPTTTSPVSVQAFINGTGASVHPWSIAQTGYTYTIDFGSAPNKPGTYNVFTLVTFADGSIARSNNLIIVIQSSTPPSSYSPPSSFSPSSSINYADVGLGALLAVIGLVLRRRER